MAEVKVRMYNVGFGDCFVVSYVGPTRTHRLLMDCGMHLSGQGPRPIHDVARQVIDDARDADGIARFDVVAASHRHFDHIAGFDSPMWADVEVAEVWLPWIENRKDPDAKRIHDKQVNAALGLQTLLAGRPDAASEILLLNSLTNDGAAATLLDGFKGHPLRRFLPSSKDPESFTTEVLPGATIHVLGPSRDEAVIRDMDPPPVQSYLRLLGIDADDAAGTPLRPFAGLGTPVPKEARDKTLKKLHSLLGRAPIELAVAIDGAVNGTSLVLVLEIGKAVILLAGDAQWGTWHAALSLPEWVKVLNRVTFMKVGHHGSHNASPRDLIDGPIPDRIPAMISVKPVDRWPRVPLKGLLETLTRKNMRWIRSDKAQADDPFFTVAEDGSTVDLVLTA
jgi:beta-lactamase superfamily II metal-dependent hydrolase